ncbi:MAG TPA: tetratricopeptide repeat protein, partial [Candidatus Eisenbacteria bacterium]|nr:tetratricopeptide repeat protein [Candidatus Eisenbacteria bacterium]
APSAAAAPVRAAAPPPAAGNSGRVAVAVGKAQAVTFDLGAMLDEFQRAVGEQLSGDAQSHYDLGMSYREMGLLDQAIASFRTAAENPDYAVRCTEMIGRCLLDQGQIDAAVEEFTNALARDLPAEAALSLRYQLGLAYEAAGRPQQALAEFEKVAGAQATYPDVAQKIRALRRSLENV